MFTGLIERTGTLKAIRTRGNGASLSITASGWDEPLQLGESISVSGACLTVSEILNDGFSADILRETIEKTSLKSASAGKKLNLERALKAGARLGGHIVTGHIDGTGITESIRKTGSDYIVRISCDPQLMVEIVKKGSIALEGISLTVTDTGVNWFEVHIIPHTWTETTLATLRTGNTVNLETDIIAKYSRKCSENANSDGSILDQLKSAGFS